MLSSKRVIAQRLARGWSQEKLATVAGLSERTIQRVEKNGACSLETQLALAAAYEISPADLLAENNATEEDEIVYKTSISGVVGLFLLGLSTPLIMLLTASSRHWELMSFMIVVGFTVVLACVNFGAKACYEIFDRSSWLVRYPSYVAELGLMVVQVQVVISYAYTVSFIASLIAALALALHSSQSLDEPVSYLLTVLRPLLYGILFVELWIRPYKSRLEWMLVRQNYA